jgi:hypothetical protein
MLNFNLPEKHFFRIDYFVNQQNAWPLAFERTHQRTRPKEVPPFEVRLHSLPVLVLASGELHVEPLQAFVEATDRFLLGHAAVALQPFHVGPGRSGNGDSKLGFSTARKTFEKQGLLEFCRKEDDLGHHWIDEIFSRCEFCGESFHRIKHLKHRSRSLA